MKITKNRLREIIRQSIQEELEYDNYFRGMLAKYGVDSPAELSDDEKSKFFSDVESGWKAKNESVNEGVRISLFDPNKNKILKTLSVDRNYREAEKEVETLNKRLSASEKNKGYYWKVTTIGESINEKKKSVSDMVKDADRIKKELNDLKREYSKSKTETNKTRVAAKEEQLRRVANAIRHARADEMERKNEGNAFGAAVVKAKEAGDSEFEVGGKTYKVESVNESIHKSLQNDIAKKLRVPTSSIEVGVGGFAPLKTNDGNVLVVIGLDSKLKTISIPQADFYDKTTEHGAYLVVKVNPSTGKLVKILGRYENIPDIKLRKYINESKKTFKVNPQIGKTKYSISFHDGVKTNKDGSPFSDLRTFKSKVELEKAIKDFKSKGYVMESSITESNYDLMFGKLGNGVTVSNRKVSDPNTKDYKFVAHISNSGKIDWKDKEAQKNPKVRREVEKRAKSMNESNDCGCNGNSINEDISVFDERSYGKKGIIIMIDDNGKKTSAIFKDKKNADKYNRNNPEDVKKLLKLAKSKPFGKAIDESMVEGKGKNEKLLDTLEKIAKKAKNIVDISPALIRAKIPHDYSDQNYSLLTRRVIFSPVYKIPIGGGKQIWIVDKRDILVKNPDRLVGNIAIGIVHNPNLSVGGMLEFKSINEVKPPKGVNLSIVDKEIKRRGKKNMLKHFQDIKKDKLYTKVNTPQSIDYLINYVSNFNESINKGNTVGVFENLDKYSKDAITDMIINLSRYEGNEDLIAHLKKILKQRTLGKLKKEHSINEGNAFGMAVTKAKQEGKKEFEFNGKTYKVKKGSYEKNEANKEQSESITESFIPGVGRIDDFELKKLLLNNPKVTSAIGANELKFAKNPNTVVIMHQSKRFNVIFTDGKMEFEVNSKDGKLVTPLRKARKQIVNYFSTKESINEGNAFGMAVTKAKEEGKTEFEFNGKTYKVKKGSYEKNKAKNESINESTKFYAFFNGKKHEIEGTSLWDAKQKAISQLKVPKSKVGLLAIVNAKDHDKGGFKFD